MASLRAPCLRHFLGGASQHLRKPQRRWARVHDVRFVATHQTQDRILEKYRQKLDQKAKEEGLQDIGQLKEAYRDKIQEHRKKSLGLGHTKTVPSPTQPTLSTAPRQQQANNPPSPPEPQPFSPPKGVKTLSSFVDVEKILSLPQKEIEYIWRLRHARDKNSLCAVVQQNVFERIRATAKRHPQFILPLPREGQGAEIHFLQWTFPSPTTATVLFTHLAEFKLRGEYSSPHTTVTHHLDLAGPKGLVLLKGAVVEGRGVTVEEGKWLLMCLQKFYGLGAEDPPKRKLMEQFSGGDEGFKVDELLEEAEKI